jgi:hypothetical protein
MEDQKIFKYVGGSYWRPKSSPQMLIEKLFSCQCPFNPLKSNTLYDQHSNILNSNSSLESAGNYYSNLDCYKCCVYNIFDCESMCTVYYFTYLPKFSKPELPSATSKSLKT